MADLLKEFPAPVRETAKALRALVREVLPAASEELDPSAKLIAYTFLPGTYKGLVVAIAPQRKRVNLLIARGAELAEADLGGLLEGTGKKARHVKVADPAQAADPRLRALVEQAASRTPRK